MTRQLDVTSFLYGGNGGFIEQLYLAYLRDPQSVDESWRQFFAGLGDDFGTIEREQKGPSWRRINGFDLLDEAGVLGPDGHAAKAAAKAVANGAAVHEETLNAIRAVMMIRAYRIRGHLIANLDPLGLEAPKPHPELDPASYGFTEADMDRMLFINNMLGLEQATLREILAILRRTYCSTIGVEYMHIYHPEQKLWIQERMEGRDKEVSFTPEGKIAILRKLVQAEDFEHFCQVKYTATKRFGLEGGEALIPAMEQIIKRGGQLGVREIVIGMPHRGRLNVLTSVMSKSYRAVFSEFEGNAPPDTLHGSGDVKYHLGTSSDREFDGNRVHLSLASNPSHLEAVDPVVLGKVRAKQTEFGDTERTQALAVLMHGDAAFAGQGLVAECFGLSELRGYRTGGTIHFIVNNQIGFTTSPNYSRSSPYPSDGAKTVQAPIFHVNGDDPEAVVHVAKVATEFRQKFHKDVVIDMFCYRRHGHNESDEPAFTQPLMYRTIAKHPTTRQIYTGKLISEGLVDEAGAEAIAAEMRETMEKDFDAARTYRPNKADWLEGRWSGFEVAPKGAADGNTGVAPETLRDIGHRLYQVPDGFHLHRTLQRLFRGKTEAIESGRGLDFATGEALAFGSLLREGYPVRLSGQDSGRGTFSQRHAVLIDQEDESRYIPLDNLSDDQARFEVHDSLLSEAAVLGFEYGYSTAEPRALVIWEAQYGDFANGAQVLIDQFITSSEAKWQRMTGLVMMLPHGYEGAGPEHSSARLERYLQLSAEGNIQVVNVTTPAQHFHVLRRQMLRKFRKPLVMMTPKSLLRHKLAVSTLDELATGTSFHRVLATPASSGTAKRVVMCAGKIYFDLLDAMEKHEVKDTTLIRLEQLYPFPDDALAAQLAKATKAEQIVWCQEEPRNMGAFFFVEPRIEQVLTAVGAKVKRARYAGRAESAAPATGLYRKHLLEQTTLVEDALLG